MQQGNIPSVEIEPIIYVVKLSKCKSTKVVNYKVKLFKMDSIPRFDPWFVAVS